MSTQVREMFTAIAGRYDLANEVLSMGMHRLWRRKAVQLSGVQQGQRVLDCATGTGDLAMQFKREVGSSGEVVGTDFCAAMLDQAPAKAQAAGLDIRFEIADAQKLPYARSSFDVASIAFGVRNVEDPAKCMAEMARVVRPGGRVVVLEFGQPSGVFGALYRFYSRRVLPRVGGLLSGNRSAYEYLDRTAGAFPCGEAYLEIMRGTGAYRECRATPLMFGAVYVYVGVVA
ncbi:MAG: bifunctional demethylmenaquinone methyltransferase/2-methoxy-6-polyprenyl-1,4-benzoquinol methylase UbiE [Myxococcota bacterium]